MKRKGLLTLLGSLCAVLLLAGAAMPAEVSIGTHGVGTSLYACGVGFAKTISDHSDLKVVAKPFAGPAAWIPLLQRGEIQAGYMALGEAVWAYTGDKVYPLDAPGLRLLATTNWNSATMGIMVRDNTPFRKIGDLRGKRVASNYGGTIMARQLAALFLRLGGLTWNDVVQVPVTSVVGGWNALREGRVDAAFGGHPAAGKIREIDASIKLRPLPFEKSANWQAIVNEILPVARPAMAKAGIGILREDILLLKAPFGLVSLSSVNEKVVEKMIKALWSNYEEVRPVHPWLARLNTKTMSDQNPMIPYHKGTISWLKEKGAWNTDLENKNKKLLEMRDQK